MTYQRDGVQSVQLSGSGGKLMLTRTVYNGEPAAATRQLAWGSMSRADKPDAAPDPAKQAGNLVSYARQPLSHGKAGIKSTLVLPAWFIATMFAMPPILWILPRLRRIFFPVVLRTD
jgi:hypothetical protein